MWCWSRGREILKKKLYATVLCSIIMVEKYMVMVHDTHTRRRRWWTKVRAVRTGWSTVSGFDLPWFSSLCSEHLCLRSSCYIDIKIFCLHILLYLLVSLAWWDWPLTWLMNHRISVLWHCWLGHVTRKIVSKMTYDVSSRTLNPTIPYLWKMLSMLLHCVCPPVVTRGFCDLTMTAAESSAYVTLGAITWQLEMRRCRW